MMSFGSELTGPGTFPRKFASFFNGDDSSWNPNCHDEPIWCLGRRYCQLPPDNGSIRSESRTVRERTNRMLSYQSEPDAQSQTGLDMSTATFVTDPIMDEPEMVDRTVMEPWKDFLDDFESRYQFTYRYNFPLIPKSNHPDAPSSLRLIARTTSYLSAGFTSDKGWGCMIRSGQSLLANALSILKHGRDWRIGTDDAAQESIISLFADDPSAPFSIHRFVKFGEQGCGRFPGEWFGPTETARCIQKFAHPDYVRVYLPANSLELYEDEFMKTAVDEDGTFHPTLILAPAHLGLNNVSDVYREGLMALFRMRQSVGIAGGQPRASHYFIAAQGKDRLLFLDPHRQQLAIPPLLSSMSEEQYEEYARAINQPNIFKSTASSLFASTMATISALQSNFARSRSSSRPASSSGTPPTSNARSDSSSNSRKGAEYGTDHRRSRSHHERSHTPPAVPPPLEMFLPTCHVRKPMAISVADIDPSMLLGFLITSREEWDGWRAELGAHPLFGLSNYPVVAISDFKPDLPGDSLDRVLTWDDDDEEGEGGEGDGDGEGGERERGNAGVGDEDAEMIEHSDTADEGPDDGIGDVLLVRDDEGFRGYIVGKAASPDARGDGDIGGPNGRPRGRVVGDGDGDGVGVGVGVGGMVPSRESVGAGGRDVKAPS